MIKTLTIILLAINLSGCFLTPKTEYVDRVKYVETSVVHPALPAETQFLNVEFSIVSRPQFIMLIETLTQKLELTPQQEAVLIDELGRFVFKDNEAWFSLDQKNYENLAENMQEIIRYIKQQQNIIIYYRETYPAKGNDLSESSE